MAIQAIKTGVKPLQMVLLLFKAQLLICKNLVCSCFLSYRSPERLRGEPHSFNSDIWSLGLTLAQCALGKFPYELEEHTMWEMLQIHASKNGAVQLSPEEFSKEFRSFVSECMTADSSKRPSAEQLLNHDFIVKNTNSNPSIERWLYENFAVQKRDGMKS